MSQIIQFVPPLMALLVLINRHKFAVTGDAGISVRSARRLDSTDALPSQRAARAWRTRADPFESVWQSEIVPLLESTPALTATTLLEEMQRHHPGQYEDTLLRTLQRRVRAWGAIHGAEREVYFGQYTSGIRSP